MITDVYFPRINGVSTSIKTFREELIKLGHQVTLLAPEYPDKIQDDENIIRIPSRYLVFDKEDRMIKSSHVLRMSNTFTDEGYDLIHIQTPFIAHYLGKKLSGILNIPVIETYHTYFEEYLFHYLPLVPRSVLRYIARKFTASQCNEIDHVVVPSQPMKDKLMDYKVTTETSIIPTGLSEDRFGKGDPESFLRSLDIDPERPRLVHVGRIAHEKNIDFLIHVLVRIRTTIPNILLIIAGNGPALKHIKSQVHNFGLDDNVQFVGYLDRNRELISCYQSAPVFVFASETETQGLVLLEAMAVGTPVVSTAVMGTKDILKFGKGALVANNNIVDFSDKVTRLLSDHSLQQQLSEDAIEYARQWDAFAMAKKQHDVYQELINTKLLPLQEPA